MQKGQENKGRYLRISVNASMKISFTFFFYKDSRRNSCTLEEDRKGRSMSDMNNSPTEREWECSLCSWGHSSIALHFSGSLSFLHITPQYLPPHCICMEKIFLKNNINLNTFN